jgi:hypothetical protein
VCKEKTLQTNKLGEKQSHYFIIDISLGDIEVENTLFKSKRVKDVTCVEDV